MFCLKSINITTYNFAFVGSGLESYWNDQMSSFACDIEMDFSKMSDPINYLKKSLIFPFGDHLTNFCSLI